MSTDRNEIARRKFAQEQQQQQFAARMQQQAAQLSQQLQLFAGEYAAGRAKPLDRARQVLTPGDQVLYQLQEGLVWTVAQVKPVLQPLPGEPVGLVEVVLVCTAPVKVMANQQTRALLKLSEEQVKGMGIVVPAAPAITTEPPPPAADEERELTADEASDKLASIVEARLRRSAEGGPLEGQLEPNDDEETQP